MTATASIETDGQRLVSQPDRGLIFLSRRDQLRLTKTPRYPVYGASGQKVGEHPGETIAFRSGRFFCPADGELELEDGRPANAAEITEWLLRHRLYGDVQEGFWKVETTAPPVSKDELQALMDAAMAFDEDTLEAILAQERDGWERSDILETAGSALDRIRAMKAQLQEEAEQKVAAETAPAPPAPKARKA